MRPINTFILSIIAASFLCVTNAQAADIVNVYSARKEALIKPLLDEFSATTSIKVNLITGKADALLKRLQVEGSASPADVFITVDAGRLHRAKQAGVLKPVSLALLEQRIPQALRDSAGYWYGLTLRARPIIYAKQRVQLNELSTYEELASKTWAGRICLRSSQAIYNQSLVAATMDSIGAEATLNWMQGMVNNLAKPPSGGDVDQLKAVAAGVCDATIANTYYLGRLINSSKPAEQAVASNLAVFWPNQSGEGGQGRGAHFNVSGAGMTKYGKHPEQAKALLEYLASDAAQRWYADINNEYPVVAGVGISETLKGFGRYKMDPINLEILGQNNRQAVQLMDRAGWR
ncbi:MAG: Fe(3+) ABC transporter substrate-binding protein [Gammaproteobacteria bacterium]|nr:Fe(3+) ABC transporter substrate-binding protein [Gammaproteobacteria bacterium]